MPAICGKNSLHRYPITSAEKPHSFRKQGASRLARAFGERRGSYSPQDLGKNSVRGCGVEIAGAVGIVCERKSKRLRNSLLKPGKQPLRVKDWVTIASGQGL